VRADATAVKPLPGSPAAVDGRQRPGATLNGAPQNGRRAAWRPQCCAKFDNCGTLCQTLFPSAIFPPDLTFEIIMRTLAGVVVLLFLPAVVRADWPAWRGAEGVGVAAADATAPLKWSATENVAWKTPLPGPGNSTPIVVGDKVFVTCATARNVKRSLICFSRIDGKKLWEKGAEYLQKEERHKTHPACGSSPVSDGKHVVAWFGSAGVYCYDLNGREIWHRDIGEFKQIWGAAAGSPVIHNNVVYMIAGPGVNAFLLALNMKDGSQKWRRDIPAMRSKEVKQFRGSWSTPVIAQRDGKPVVICSLPDSLRAVDAGTGEDVWTCDGLTALSYTTPLVTRDTVVAMSGYHGNALAVKRGGSGDVTGTHRLWLHTQRKMLPQRVGSGVVVGGHIYIYNENGQVWCIELKSGDILWQERVGGKSWASMTYVANRLYVITESGTTFVIAPDPKQCNIVAENKLGELTRGSLAFSDGQVFARTYDHLYCIGKSKDK